jgi:hypothetical protein
VRHLVTSQLDSLRQSLADAGMSLQRFDVSHGNDGSHGQYRQEFGRSLPSHDGPWNGRPLVAPRYSPAAVPRGRIDVIV